MAGAPEATGGTQPVLTNSFQNGRPIKSIMTFEKDYRLIPFGRGGRVYQSKNGDHLACPVCMDGDHKRIVLKKTSGERSWL